MWESESLNHLRYFCNWLSCLITNVSAQPIYSGADFPCLSTAAPASVVFCFQGGREGERGEERRETFYACLGSEKNSLMD